MTIAKPVMRGLLASQIKRNIIIACGLSVVAATSWKLLVQDPRKRVFAEFYKNYDAQAEFDRIRNLGLFNSCKPDGEVEE